MAPTADWPRLARAVFERRKEMGAALGQKHPLARQRLTDAGGPAPATIEKIEKGTGDDYTRDVIAKTEKALGWRPGSWKAVLAGGEPVLDAASPDRVEAGALLVVAPDAEFIASVWSDPLVSEDDKREVVDDYLKELRMVRERAERALRLRRRPTNPTSSDVQTVTGQFQ